MKYLAKSRNFWTVLAADIVFLTVSYLLSYVIRFETLDLSRLPHYALMVRTLPLILLCKLIFFYFFGLYRGVWRYTGIHDLLSIIKATTSSSATIVIVLFYLLRTLRFPRSVLVIDWLLSLVLVAGFRVLIRLLHSSPLLRFANLQSLGPHPRPLRPVNLLILGAGDAGEKMLRELLDNPRLSYRVIGFLDDDPKKRGRSIHRIPVWGKIADLPRLVRDKAVEEVLIAIPSASGSQMRQIVKLCQDAGVRFKTIPGLGDLIEGTVSIKELRDVAYEDLLGRDPVQLDDKVISSCLSGKRILVTGAGGSIGSELCRQIARYSPELLVCYERTENSLFHLEMNVLRNMRGLPYRAYIGDVLDQGRLSEVFAQTLPQVVFHAAAYKHVPLMELNPTEAIKNNLLGTHRIASLALRSEVERFVLISTDKAVRPLNIMGASKRAAELIVQSLGQAGSTRYITVRFGNVVGSEGSVVPLFRSQIARGGPVTVTHPEATRFFMSIPEAAQLILEAASIGQGGEVFLLEMGKPVRIVELAEDLIRLSGKEPYQDIEIVFTGLRPGEKLHEELIAPDEGTLPTPHPKIRVLRPSLTDPGRTMKALQAIDRLIAESNGLPLFLPPLLAQLRIIVPEYRPGPEVTSAFAPLQGENDLRSG